MSSVFNASRNLQWFYEFHTPHEGTNKSGGQNTETYCLEHVHLVFPPKKTHGQPQSQRVVLEMFIVYFYLIFPDDLLHSTYAYIYIYKIKYNIIYIYISCTL